MVIDLEKFKNDGAPGNKPADLLPNFFNKLKAYSFISQKDIIFFIQNLQVMIKSGLPLDKSLRTLALQTKNSRFKNILNELAMGTEAGVSLHDSLQKYENVFGVITVNMVKAGEISGRLDEVLKQIYLQIKKGYELKSKVKAALVYPLIVIIAMIGIAIFMFIFVIPKITAMFDQIEAELPLATKMLINVSNFTLANGPLVLISLVILVILLILSFKAEKIVFFYHRVFLALPIFGEIVKKINLAKFSRTISSLIKTDISIVKTLDITAQVLPNKIYKKALMQSSVSLSSGASLTDILKKYPNLFPPVIIQMTAAGEETGSLDDILAEIATFYEEEVDQIMKTLPSIIEPLLILILGVGVGAMAVAIIMPMYSLTQQF